MARFGEILALWQNPQSLWQFFMVYLIFGIIFNLVWQILYPIGQLSIDVKVQKLKNNLAIWSHCLHLILSIEKTKAKWNATFRKKKKYLFRFPIKSWKQSWPKKHPVIICSKISKQFGYFWNYFFFVLSFSQQKNNKKVSLSLSPQKKLFEHWILSFL